MHEKTVKSILKICTNSFDHTQTHFKNRKEKDVVPLPPIMRHISQLTRITRRYNLKQSSRASSTVTQRLERTVSVHEHATGYLQNGD